jgi:hypothetical protein
VLSHRREAQRLNIDSLQRWGPAPQSDLAIPQQISNLDIFKVAIDNIPIISNNYR